MRIPNPARKNEHGVTILIVGMTLLVLMAMAALAIDVASLYEYRSEAQRAADAAALAGAKMFVSSSFSSSNSISVNDVCQSGAAGLNAAVNKQAAAALLVNPIAGQPAVIKSIQCSNANPLNPRVTVVVQSATSPAFFSRIWVASNTVTATATAEAYNPSGRTLPVQLTNIKPWFIPNCDPGGGDGPCNGASGYFINPVDGTIKNNGSFVGQILHLTRQFTIGGNVGGDHKGDSENGSLSFYGLRYPISPAPSFPSTGAVSCDDPNINSGDTYIDNIAGTSSLPMSCGMPIGPKASASPYLFSFEGLGPGGGPTVIGTKCLIHASGNGNNQGQDEFSNNGIPVTINGGSNNPNPTLRVPNISRSDSVVTAPLFDGRTMDNSSAPAPIIGFLQLGVTETNGGGGGGGSQLLNAMILNVVGCNPSVPYPPSNPISAGGSSPIPVRLVQTQ